MEDCDGGLVRFGNDVPYTVKGDCHNEHGVEGMCLEGAIKNYTSQLVTYDHKSHGKPYNLTEALLFLSHFMGDIHQPLHVGFTSDRGGNSIKLYWYRRKSNLHHIWDSGIIETAMKDFYDNDLEAMIEDIQTNITEIWSNDVTTWEECHTDETSCPKLYADESIILACKWAYQDVEEDDILEDDYFLSRLPIIENQLAKGGIRLAATLNLIFDSKQDYTLHSEFLACTEPIASDTDLKGENLEVLKERVFKAIDSSFGLEMLSSGLVEPAAFPPATQILAVQHKDVVVRLFTQTLTKGVADWFSHLQVGYVTDWQTMKTAFEKWFKSTDDEHSLLAQLTQMMKEIH
ncbi:endonuclease 2-like [Cryptomeria japonica]|uniref:endonuclease 2-like n=1 Tax=Cryptomeria japonica TaxID=3369 RepID=UPI0027DA5074|nr:endonuclease 2-like [Cryptomeria japonica]